LHNLSPTKQKLVAISKSIFAHKISIKLYPKPFSMVSARKPDRNQHNHAERRIFSELTSYVMRMRNSVFSPAL